MTINYTLTVPIAVISSITTLLFSPSLSLATKLDFIVENKTNVDLVNLSIQGVNSSPSQSSLRSNELVKSGESVVIRFRNSNSSGCVYNVTGVFSDGDIVQENNVNLCKTEIYTFSDN
jgi:hypothetical protein